MKKLALVLGGGSAKGFAHVGVIKVLEEFDIRPDLIVGTSMGAIIGAIYASGVDSNSMQEICAGISKKTITDISLVNMLKNGCLYKGKKRQKFLYDILKDVKHEELAIPFVAVATNLNTGEQVNLDKGLVWKNVLASSAVPAVFPAVEINGEYLSDGCIKDNLPIKVAKQIMSDAIILSVDVIGDYDKQVEDKGLKVITQILNMSTLYVTEKTERDAKLSDLNIKITQPDVYQMDYDSETALKAIKNGETAMRANIERLKELLK